MAQLSPSLSVLFFWKFFLLTTKMQTPPSQSVHCPKYLVGHCPQKGKCLFSHDIETCQHGRSCANISTLCPLRHPKICQKFQTGKCGYEESQGAWKIYKKCSFLHVSSNPSLPTELRHGVASLHRGQELELHTGHQGKLQADLSKALKKIETLEEIVQNMQKKMVYSP